MQIRKGHFQEVFREFYGIFRDLSNRKVAFFFVEGFSRRVVRTIDGEITGVIENLLKITRAKVGGWVYNFQKKEYFASDEVFRIFEVEKKDFSGSLEEFFGYIHPENVEEVKKAMVEAQKGRALNIKCRIKTGKGKEKFIHARGEVFMGKGKNPERLIGLLQDVTEQVYLNQDLEEIEHEVMQGDYLRELIGTARDLTKANRIQEELSKTHKQIHEVQRAFKMGSWVADFKTGEVRWSPTTYEIYGIDREAFDHKMDSVLNYVHPKDRQRVQNLLNKAPEENPFQIDFSIVRPDGKERTISHLAEIIRDDKGKILQFRGTIQDVTERMDLEKKVLRAQKKIVEIEKRFKILIENGDDVVEIIDEKGTIRYISPAIRKMTGYTKEELEGESLFTLFVGKELIKIKRLFRKSLKSPDTVVKGFILSETKEGKPLYLDIQMNNHIKDATVRGIVLYWRDVTHRVEMQRRITHIANHDELTQLPNRSYFQRKVKAAISRAKELNHRVTIFMLDIDSFKQINDALRVGLGDQVIVAASQRVKNALEEEAVICRYYGDQFGIMVENTRGIQRDQEIAGMLIDLFKKPFLIDQYELFITISVGFSMYPEDGTRWEDFLKHACTALLKAKEEGKNRFKAYSPVLDIKNFKTFTLRNDLRKAIDDEQFTLHFQPIVNLETGEILAAEALSRWEHPEWGMVSPEEFIPLLEESGLIIDLGRQILRKVCRYYRDWMKPGMPQIKISVNYSGVQFYQKNFVEDIEKTLREFDLSPKFLIIEITESVLIKQSGRTLEDIKTLQKMGVQFAIDDFGTGYSSLTYLSSMRVDILKLDRGFIREVPQDDRSNKILGAIVNLSQDLRMKLVAEGIEDWNQLFILRALHCVAGQGYIYREPVNHEEFEKILKGKYLQPLQNVVNFKEYLPESDENSEITVYPPLDGKMTIREFVGKEANIGFAGTLIQSIGKVGLRFLANVQLPLRKDFILEFEVKLDGETMTIQGFPARMEKLDKGIYQYGLVFTDSMKADRLREAVHKRMISEGDSSREEEDSSREEEDPLMEGMTLMDIKEFFQKHESFADRNPW